MTLTPNSEKIKIIGGNSTVGSPLVAWLVPPPKSLARESLSNNVLHSLGVRVGATDVLCRSVDHPTTREKDYDGKVYWYYTDSHLTVFCLIDGVWKQGHVFFVHAVTGWYIMPDYERMEYTIGGQGVQLWDYTTARNPSSMAGGAILAFVRSTGRIPWLFVPRAAKPQQSAETTTNTGSLDSWGADEPQDEGDNSEWWNISAEGSENLDVGEGSSEQAVEVDGTAVVGGMHIGRVLPIYFTFTRAALVMRVAAGAIRSTSAVVAFGDVDFDETITSNGVAADSENLTDPGSQADAVDMLSIDSESVDNSDDSISTTPSSPVTASVDNVEPLVPKVYSRYNPNWGPGAQT